MEKKDKGIVAEWNGITQVKNGIDRIKNIQIFKDYIKGKLSLSIEMGGVTTPTSYNIYKWICAYLKKQNPELRKIRHIMIPPNSNIKIRHDTNNRIKFVKRINIYSEYPIICRISKCGWVIILTKANGEDKNIVIHFVGRDAYKNMHECIQYIYRCENKSIIRNNSIICRDIIGSSYSMRTVKRKNSSDIIWDKLDELTSYIKLWGTMKDEYINRNIPYKLSILLYGKPGTGKTSICNYISGITGKSISIISTDTKVDDMKEWISDKKSEINRSILLFEDIDIFFDESNSYNINVKNDDDSNNKKLHYLLQLFSGLNTPDDVIIICTTNYPEKLDKRLTRPGRFDLVYEVQEFNREEAARMCDMYEVPSDILLKDRGDVINPAELQSACIQYSIQERIKSMKESLS